MHKIDFYNPIWGCPKSNERYTKFGGFDKLNHRNANLLDSPVSFLPLTVVFSLEATVFFEKK